MLNVPAQSFLQLFYSSSSDVIFHLEVASFLYILHQSSPLLHWLLQCHGLIPLVQSLCPDHSLLCLCLWWHLLTPLLWDNNICLRLFCAFLPWPWCWVSLHWPSHLGSGQSTTSTTNARCYHHCNDYSSRREQQCQLTKIIITTFCVGQPFMVIKCDDFISFMGQMAASLDKRLLVCTFTFYALWYPEHSIPSDL